VIALTVALSSGAVLRAAGRIWLGWGTAESPSPEAGTADDSGDESEDRPDTTEPESADDGAPGSDDGPEIRARSERPGRVPLTMALPPLALLAIGLGLGLAPGIEAHSAAAAAAFSDRAVYAAQVLGTRGATVPVSGPVVDAAQATSAAGLLTDLGQVAAALCVAAIALDRRAVRLRRALAAGTGWLRRLHSGLVGDQVTWLVAGLALLAAAAGVALR
jgi:multicomponent Na+:H+ antiporter subunit D